MVNELHLSFMRDNTNLGQPLGGRNVSLGSQGFTNANGTPSIVALDPKGQSVENLNFNGYSTGAAANQLIQVNNTIQVVGQFRKGAGQPHHEVWRRVPRRSDQRCARSPSSTATSSFPGTETGVDFADFLIGVPSQFNQSQLNPFYARNKYVGSVCPG